MQHTNMEVRTFKYRIYPSKKQQHRLVNFFKICKTIYNELIELNKSSYESEKKSLSKFDFNNHLSGKYSQIHSQVRQNVSDRVHKAFQNFFRKVKDPSCKKKGFPRFKSRVRSITYPQSGFKFVSDKKLYTSKIGNIPIVLHRVPKGVCKTMTIKQNYANQWFALFSCEIDYPEKTHISNEEVGIDVGISKYATLSNGNVTENPRHILKSKRKLKLLHRRLSRKKKGSNNRNKARFRLAKGYVNITNQREDFLHKLSRNIVNDYSFIAIEDLEIRSMVTNHHLARSINDASWNTFFQFLEYKAITSGSKIVKVNPSGTTQICSKCGNEVKKTLSVRIHECSFCGLSIDRDLNAAKNILSTAGHVESYACEDHVRPSFEEAEIVEAGTIRDKN